MSLDLLKDLEQADLGSRGIRPCSICALVEDPTREEDVRQGVKQAAAPESKIGSRKLAAIFARHELGIGRRTIIRHREEGHLK